MRGAAAGLLILLLTAGPAFGQAHGPTPADPWVGLSDADLERLATDLRAGRDAQALAEGQKALIHELMGQVEELEGTIAALKEAEQARAIAVALAEDRDKRRAENEAALRDLLDRPEKLLAKATDRI